MNLQTWGQIDSSIAEPQLSASDRADMTSMRAEYSHRQRVTRQIKSRGLVTTNPKQVRRR